MTERVKRLADEARQLTPAERAELLDALMAMVQEDNDGLNPLYAEGEGGWDEMGAESFGYLLAKS